MKSFLKRTLVFLMTFSILIGCLPLQTFAAEQYMISDKFDPGTHGEYPEVKLVIKAYDLTDGSSKKIAEPTIKPDGSFSFTMDKPYDVLSFMVAENEPYRIVFTDTDDIWHPSDIGFTSRTDELEQICTPIYTSNHVTMDIEGKLGVIYFEPITGSAKLIKVKAGTEDVVSGAKYEIFYVKTDGNDIKKTSIGTYKTDNDGTIPLENILCGQYEYKEVEAPSGYFINSATGTFTVTEGEVTTEKTTDEPECSVKIIKTDEKTGRPMANVKFELYNADTRTKVDIRGNDTTNTNGELLINGLGRGNYYFIETATNDNYELDTNKEYPFVLTASHTSDNPLELQISNKPWPIISFVKVDKDDNSIQLDGAIFDLYKGNTKIASNLEGSSFSMQLEPSNDYKLVETKAPTNYKLPVNDYTFAVVSGKSETHTIPNEMHKTDISISKYDAEKGMLLGNAVFHFYGEGVDETWTSKETESHIIRDLTPGTYTLVEEKMDGYVRASTMSIVIGENCNTVTVDGKDIGKPFEIKVYNNPIYLTIHKLDSKTDEYITGAEFELYEFVDGEYKPHDEYPTLTTRGQKIIIREISTGKYMLKETKYPNGYNSLSLGAYSGLTEVSQNNNEIYFTINEIEEHEIYLYNQRDYGSITINKTGKQFESVTQHENVPNFVEFWFNLSENLPLSGAKFALYANEAILNPANGSVVYEANEKIAEKTTDALGNVVFDTLLYGSYRVEEVYAPNGYEKSNDPLQFTINSTTPHQKADVVNKNETISITVTKQSEIGNKPLSGAIFGIYSVEGNGLITKDTLIGTFVTDARGNGTFETCVPKGKYIVKEIVPPEGYILSTQEASIDFTQPVKDGNNVFNAEKNKDLLFVNKPIKLTINKVDAEDENSFVVGTQLQLTNTETNVTYEHTVTKNSPWVIEEIPVGTYTLKEIKEATGYVLYGNEDTVQVTMSSNNQHTIKNDRVKGSITVIKKASDGKNVLDEVIQGVKFQLWDGDTFISEGVTGADGKITFNDLYVANYANGEIITGENGVKTYTIKEISTPNGYLITSETTTVDFDLSKANENIHKTVTIANEYTKLQVSKIDAGTGEMIAGAKLAIYKMEDAEMIDDTFIIKDGAKPIYEWISEKGKTHLIEKELPVGKYVLVELETPTMENENEAYIKAENQGFEITGSGLVTLVVINDFTRVEISKINANGEKLQGATLLLYKSEDVVDGIPKDGAQPIHTITSSNIAATKIDRLPLGDYTVVETKAPDGYAMSNEKRIGYEYATFSLVDNAIIEVNLVNDMIRVNVTKTEPQIEGKPIVNVIGAKLALYKTSDIVDGNIKDGAKPFEYVIAGETIVCEWISDGTVWELVGIPAGEYIIVETEVPDGYVRSANTPITVKSQTAIQHFNIENDFNKVKINKYIEDGKTTINGAHFAVYAFEDATLVDGKYVINDGAKPYTYEFRGNTIKCEWVSTTDAKLFEGIPSGQYILSESKSPNGYYIADNIMFTVRSTPDEQVFGMTNNYATLVVNKIDAETNKHIKGAILALYRTEDIIDGEPKEGSIAFDTWTSDGTPHIITHIPVGNYTLIELVAPAGYVRTTKTEKIEIKPQTEEQSITMKNNFTRVDFIKIEPTKDDDVGVTYVSGAKLALYKKSDVINVKESTLKEGAKPFQYEFDGETIICEWITTNDIKTFERLPVGDYVLIEVETPAGYVRAEGMEIKVEEMTKTQPFIMINDYTKVVISKIDIDTKELLESAHLALYTLSDIEDGKVKADAKPFTYTANGETIVCEWVTNKAPKEFNRIPAGTYVLVELDAPKGYVRAENKMIDIQCTTAEPQPFVMENDFTKVNIYKVELGNKSNNLIGTKLALYSANDVNDDNTIKEGAKIIESWTSDGKAHSIKRLPVGNYVIIETEASAGYVKKVRTDFTVEETVTPKDVYVENDYIKIEISKLDNDNDGLPVVGAKLALYRTEDIVDGKPKEGAEPFKYTVGDETIVCEWITDGNAKAFVKIPVGNYALVELEAPKGYILSDKVVPVDIKEDADVQTFIMKNDYIKIEITKTDKETGEIIAGAKLNLVDEDGNVVYEWISTNEPHIIKRIPVGIYKLIEVTAPEGYLLNSEEVEVIVEETTEIKKYNISNEFDDYDITFSKIDATTKEELPGATLVLKDESGKIIEEWVSTTEPHIIKGLIPGKYTLVEITAPEGYFKAESIEFELLKDGKTTETKIVMENDYTKVAIHKLQKGTDKYVVGAELHIEDKDGNIIVEKWTTEDGVKMIYNLPAGKYVLVEDSAPNGYLVSEKVEFEVTDSGEIVKVVMEDEYVESSSDTEEKPDSPQTGDNSNIGFYFFTMITSLICLVVLLITKKKQYNKN